MICCKIVLWTEKKYNLTNLHKTMAITNFIVSAENWELQLLFPTTFN